MAACSSAEFLMESLAADALLLETWAAREPLEAAIDASLLLPAPQNPVLSASSEDDDDPSKTAALRALEMRRKYNRESMRRTRQRKSKDLAKMRDRIQELELQFEQLRMRQQQANTTNLHLVEHKAGYTAMAEVSRILKTENFLLQRTMLAFDVAKLRMQHTIASSSEGDDALSTEMPAEQYFEYVAVTQAQTQDAIGRCYKRLTDFEATAKPLDRWLSDSSNPCAAFGWTIKWDLRDGLFFLSMAKRVMGVSAKAALDRSWALMARSRRPKMPNSRGTRGHVRSAVLQEVNDSTRVIGTDWAPQSMSGVIMRSIGVRFHLTTEHGYAIGLASMGLSDPLQDRSVRYRQVDSWHEYVDIDVDGEIGVEATMQSIIQFHERENLQLRLTNMLCQAWRWETEIMQSQAKWLLS